MNQLFSQYFQSEDDHSVSNPLAEYFEIFIGGEFKMMQENQSLRIDLDDVQQRQLEAEPITTLNPTSSPAVESYPPMGGPMPVPDTPGLWVKIIIVIFLFVLAEFVKGFSREAGKSLFHRTQK